MIEKLGKFIKKKVDRKVNSTKTTREDIINNLNIKRQYLHDLENGKRTPSPDLMKKMISLLNLNDKEKIEFYDLVSESHKNKRIPADIEEYIIENANAKDEIRKIIYGINSREVK